MVKPGVIIIGAGHGGVQAAASLRQQGYDGSVTLISSETELPYHKPPLSKTFLKAPQAGSQMLRPESFYTDKKIELCRGETVVEIDRAGRKIALKSGVALPFEHLVLAMGARPIMPPLPGIELANVLPLRSFADAGALRDALPDAQNIVIIGGGFIGMEIAHTLAGLGKNITLIEMGPRVLGRSVAPAISEHAQNFAIKAGINLRTGIAVVSLSGDGGFVSHVQLSDGQTIRADLVIIGAGVVPDSDLAKAAGLATQDGILVDHAMRTSDPHILAIGDVARYHHPFAQQSVRLESVQNATDQARHAARTISGDLAPYNEVAWFWSDMGSDKLQTAGLSFGADRYIVSGMPEDGAFSVWHFAGTRLVAVDSINRAAEHVLARKLLSSGISPVEADIHAGRDRLKELLPSGRQ